ncbi:MAG: zinc ribbon domain-containing protein [Ezakiella sp.]|nr:zinc ribbon domain-containing protein [Ezakiella sp.]MDD7471294.1 zinc ribbon domain-containing protein [Bacillota bacterium]MDY3923611.1 zinc ribbon domain-containing protein [Ezakiella sp.]
MNNFFKDLGINFSKDPETQKEALAKKQIKDSEEKMNFLLDALNETAKKIAGQNKECFEIIGRIIYNGNIDFSAIGFDDAEIKKAFESIKKNDEELDNLEQKKNSIIERYTDEIEILKSAIRDEAPEEKTEAKNGDKADGVKTDVIYCAECGAEQPMGAIFCSKCGNKLIK